MRLSGVFPVALVGLVVAFSPTGGGGMRPFHLVSPEHLTKSGPLALIWHPSGQRLARVDERTLRVRGRESRRLGFVDGWAFERPSDQLLALATNPSEYQFQSDSIRFVRTANLKLLSGRTETDGFVHALLWTQPNRLVALVDNFGGSAGFEVLVIDPASRRVLSKTSLPGLALKVARTPDALIVLETVWNTIGPAKLDVIRGDGTVQSIDLARVDAGIAAEQGSGTLREPALIVDSNGDNAYVIQPDGPVAVVDLRTLAVSYHGLKASQSMLARIAAWLTPSAEAKNVSGHWRSGTWLGDGLIAITGSDTASDVGTPSGLAIVDTRDWSVRMLDPGADSVFVADGLLLATGGINGGSTNSPPPGMGLAAYGTDWSLKFRLFDGSVVGVYYVLGNRAYVGNFESDAVSVVDLTSGHVIGRRQGPLPLLLLGDSSS